MPRQLSSRFACARTQWNLLQIARFTLGPHPRRPRRANWAALRTFALLWVTVAGPPSDQVTRFAELAGRDPCACLARPSARAGAARFGVAHLAIKDRAHLVDGGEQGYVLFAQRDDLVRDL